MPIYLENMEFAFSNTKIMLIRQCDSMGSRADLAAVKVLGRGRRAMHCKERERRGLRKKCLNVDPSLGYSSYLG